jgi:FlgD Ig-like domain/Periplasmic copper-binding protein (NosD)
MKKTFLMPVLLLVLNLSATIINVPADHPTIQEGINASVDSDTVLVQPGDYNESINFNGRNITLGSLFLTTADSSYIDLTEGIFSVTFENNENNNASIVGFTIGNNYLRTSTVYCCNASPVIRNNYIYRGGSGIRCDSLCSAQIINNKIMYSQNGVYLTYGASAIIINNIIQEVGKGVFLGSDCSASIIGNKISCSNGSNVRGIDAFGNSTAIIYSNEIFDCLLGIQVSTSASPIINNFIHDCEFGINSYADSLKIINNTIVNNVIGIYGSNIQSKIINCIVWGNTVNVYPIIQANFMNSCIEYGLPVTANDVGGNTARYPCFTEPEMNDFTLMENSPCIDAGVIDTTGLNLPEYDLIGNDRIQDGNGDNSLIIDMGCFEAGAVINPGFISGTITLSGGNGNVQDAFVAVGAPVHPDENGEYLITIGTTSSPYNIQTLLDGYYPQIIQNVTVIPDEITENVNFELEFYQPNEYLEFTPYSIQLIDHPECDFEIKNISMIDITISDLNFLSSFGSFYYLPTSLTFPHVISPGDSLEMTICLDLPTQQENREIHDDTILIITNVETFALPLTWNSDLLSDAEENTIQIQNLCLSNFPNPFNPSTTIYFSIQNDSDIELSIYNIKGQKINTLAQNDYSKGTHSIIWNGDDESNKSVSSGIYFYKLLVNGKAEAVKKCLLLK